MYPGHIRKKKCVFDVASFSLAAIAISIHWLVFFEWGIVLFAIPLMLSLLAIVFGSITSYRLIKKRTLTRKDDKTGLAGFTLGILTVMFTISWLVISRTYLWGW